MAHELIYDRKEQLIKIQAYVVPEETLYAVYDLVGETVGFIGITDLRVIFMDTQFIGRAPAIVTLPFSKIEALGCEDTSTTFETNRMRILSSGRDWLFEFTSADKAYNAYQLIMGNLLQGEASGMM